MENEALCFCGSGKQHKVCHGHISRDSMVARLYVLERELDGEIERQRAENTLTPVCEPGCCECCSRCFCVSETELAQILDWSLDREPARLEKAIENARRQWETLKTEAPGIAGQIRGGAPLISLMSLSEVTLPFPCIFLDENGCCRIYEVRPLACRLHGTGFVNLTEGGRPCRKLPPVLSAWDRFVNLTSFEEALTRFVLLNDGERVIVRRPSPLFYYFQLIFKDNKKPEEIRHTEFFRFLTEVSAKAYTEALLDYFNKKQQP